MGEVIIQGASLVYKPRTTQDSGSRLLPGFTRRRFCKVTSYYLSTARDPHDIFRYVLDKLLENCAKSGKIC